MEEESSKYKKRCSIQDIIARLFNEMSEKHQIDEHIILLQYQDNILNICVQDYDSLNILEEIKFNV